jgi:acetyl esterase/lipase
MHPSALPAFTLLGLIAAPLAAQAPVYQGPPPTAITHYGADSLQYGELRIPDGVGPFPVAITIHGGCWLDNLGEGSITPLAAALTEGGIATWNVEYRRLGHKGGGWPGTFLDVGAGIDYLRTMAKTYPLDLEHVVLVGHSSGAQLAVWGAGRPGLPKTSEIRGSSPLAVRAAVGIDGPMDLAAWERSGVDVKICRSPVVARLMGGSPDEYPDRYRQASPAEMPRIRPPIFLTPAAMMLPEGEVGTMTRRAQTTGARVTVRPIPNVGHLQMLAPGRDGFTAVIETIRAALGLP